jgi:hypothetical protein
MLNKIDKWLAILTKSKRGNVQIKLEMRKADVVTHLNEIQKTIMEYF